MYFHHYNFHWLQKVGFGVLVIGAMFRIQHWPYSRLLILIGISLVFLVHLVIYLRKKKKDLLDHLILIEMLLFTYMIIPRALPSRPYHFPFRLEVAVLAIAIYLFIYFFGDRFRQEED